MSKSNIGSISELIDKLKSGELEGSIKIILDNNGKINELLIQRKATKHKEEIEQKIAKVKLKTKKLENTDFSDLDVSGSDFSGINLSGSDFSNSKIINSDFSDTSLYDTNFYRAHISQTDLSNSYGIKSLESSYVTGSVNLYNVGPTTSGEISNPYDYEATHQEVFPDDKTDISRLLPFRRSY